MHLRLEAELRKSIGHSSSPESIRLATCSRETFQIFAICQTGKKFMFGGNVVSKSKSFGVITVSASA
jgi:hypothetical protein